MSKVLVIVDVQNDFCERGALAVAGGRKVAHDLVESLESNAGFDHIVTTQDWHIDPGDHFEKWPVHCRAGTLGAEIAEPLKSYLKTSPEYFGTIYKGAYDDGYSGFEGELSVNPAHNLYHVLLQLGATEVVYCGLATDVCVAATALHENAQNFGRAVWADMTAGVDKDETDRLLKHGGFQSEGVAVV